jgi:predicted RNase H-like HicB family nuclease
MKNCCSPGLSRDERNKNLSKVWLPRRVCVLLTPCLTLQRSLFVSFGRLCRASYNSVVLDCVVLWHGGPVRVKGFRMSLVVELIPDEEEGGFTARIPDIPAYGEGDTEDAAIADLREAVRGYIETFGLDDALSRISQPSVRSLDWDLTELARG